MSADRLIDEITEELKIELEGEPSFNAAVLRNKVKDAYRKVRGRKCYENTSKTEDGIIDDLYAKHYQDIKDVALYNFAKIGGDFETSHSENSISRSWVSENEVLGNITAYVKIL